MEKMKQRIAITRFPFESQFGGEELHTLQVAKHWREQGHEVMLFSSCPVLIDLFSEDGFKVLPFTLTKPPVTKGRLIMFTLFYKWYLFKAWQLAKAIKKAKVSRVYCLSFSEKLLLPWFLNNERYYFVEHARIGNWFYQNPWKKLYYKFAKAGQVVTVSKMMACDLHYPEAIVIPNGVDVAQFKRENVIRNWERPQLTTVGRLTADKGIDVFIDALIELNQTNKNWQATIVGQGPLAPVFKTKIMGAGLQDQIELITKLPRPQLIMLLKKTEIFCLLSPKTDPFGLVVAEAMAAGAIPLATNKCGIVDYSHLIYQVRANNSEAVVTAVKHITADKLSVDAVQQEAADKFALNKMLDAYEQLLV